MIKDKFLAGIVLYNPDIIRLEENIKSLLAQIHMIVCIDNNSSNIDLVQKLLSNYSNIIIIRNNKNQGIAKALNQILIYAKENNYEWILTMDQDSVVRPMLLKEYAKQLGDRRLAMITCLFQERNVREIVYEENEEVEEVKKCITSGCFTNVVACLEIGGFNEKLFIDYVDFDMCIRLRQNGYKLCRINKIGMVHETGKVRRFYFRNKLVKICGNPIEIYNESPIRVYYFFRNIVYFYCKYGKEGKEYTSFLHIVWRAFLVIIFEKPKLKKVYFMFKGIKEGLNLK